MKLRNNKRNINHKCNMQSVAKKWDGKMHYEPSHFEKWDGSSRPTEIRSDATEQNLCRAGVTVETVEAMDRQTLMDSWASLVAEGKDQLVEPIPTGGGPSFRTRKTYI